MKDGKYFCFKTILWTPEILNYQGEVYDLKNNKLTTCNPGQSLEIKAFEQIDKYLRLATPKELLKNGDYCIDNLGLANIYAKQFRALIDQNCQFDSIDSFDDNLVHKNGTSIDKIERDNVVVWEREEDITYLIDRAYEDFIIHHSHKPNALILDQKNYDLLAETFPKSNKTIYFNKCEVLIKQSESTCIEFVKML